MAKTCRIDVMDDITNWIMPGFEFILGFLPNLRKFDIENAIEVFTRAISMQKELVLHLTDPLTALLEVLIGENDSSSLYSLHILLMFLPIAQYKAVFTAESVAQMEQRLSEDEITAEYRYILSRIYIDISEDRVDSLHKLITRYIEIESDDYFGIFDMIGEAPIGTAALTQYFNAVISELIENDTPTSNYCAAALFCTIIGKDFQILLDYQETMQDLALRCIEAEENCTARLLLICFATSLGRNQDENFIRALLPYSQIISAELAKLIYCYDNSDSFLEEYFDFEEKDVLVTRAIIKTSPQHLKEIPDEINKYVLSLVGDEIDTSTLGLIVVTPLSPDELTSVFEVLRTLCASEFISEFRYVFGYYKKLLDRYPIETFNEIKGSITTLIYYSTIDTETEINGAYITPGDCEYIVKHSLKLLKQLVFYFRNDILNDDEVIPLALLSKEYSIHRIKPFHFILLNCRGTKHENEIAGYCKDMAIDMLVPTDEVTMSGGLKIIGALIECFPELLSDFELKVSFQMPSMVVAEAINPVTSELLSNEYFLSMILSFYQKYLMQYPIIEYVIEYGSKWLELVKDPKPYVQKYAYGMLALYGVTCPSMVNLENLDIIFKRSLQYVLDSIELPPMILFIENYLPNHPELYPHIVTLFMERVVGNNGEYYARALAKIHEETDIKITIDQALVMMRALANFSLSELIWPTTVFIELNEGSPIWYSEALFRYLVGKFANRPDFMMLDPEFLGFVGACFSQLSSFLEDHQRIIDEVLDGKVNRINNYNANLEFMVSNNYIQ